MSEEKSFLDQLQEDENPFAGQENNEEQHEETNEKSEEDYGELKPRSRRERRLKEKYDAERESSRMLAEKLRTFSEAKSSIEDEADYLKSVERIYGTDSPEAQLATEALKKALLGVREDAENRAYARWQQENEARTAAEREAEAELDDMVDEIEETYGVTLTPAQEKAYFQLMEKASRKDRDGNIIEYADPHYVFEVFRERTKKAPSRAKELASRSLQDTTGSSDSKLEMDATERLLRENGII